MRSRLEPILRIVCLFLGACLVVAIVRATVHGDPLGHSSIPELPTLGHSATSAPQTNRPPKMNAPPKADVPSAVQQRIDRIKESEILAPFMRPMPMALLGIAGEDAFLRTADGQTKMLIEGAEASGIKLLRIGTNRVLIEENGEKKELTLFSGMGGESLLPPETQSSATNATVPKPKDKP